MKKNGLLILNGVLMIVLAYFGFALLYFELVKNPYASLMVLPLLRFFSIVIVIISLIWFLKYKFKDNKSFCDLRLTMLIVSLTIIFSITLIISGIILDIFKKFNYSTHIEIAFSLNIITFFISLLEIFILLKKTD